MKKLTQKQREWLKKKSERAMRKLSKGKRRHVSAVYETYPAVRSVRNEQKTHTAKAPISFSLINNVEEAIKYFSEVHSIIQKCRFGDKIYFDFSAINYITADAIMYIIALVKNVKRIKALKIECEGNLPDDAKSRETIENVGFYKYVRAASVFVRSQGNEKIQITSGTQVEEALAGKLCDFVHNKCSPAKCNTKRLFPLIIELMTNTHQHAYENCVMSCNWYVFAEDTTEGIHFLFLDTGVGIPSTIEKNHKEKILDLLLSSDSEYIASALRGEFRSSTGQSYRGKGLPEIYEDVAAGAVEKFLIISGYGFCVISNDGTIDRVESKNEFKGTLYSWNFNKRISGGSNGKNN